MLSKSQLIIFLDEKKYVILIHGIFVVHVVRLLWLLLCKQTLLLLTCRDILNIHSAPLFKICHMTTLNIDNRHLQFRSIVKI